MKLLIVLLAFLLITSLPLWCQARQSEQFCTIKGTVFDEQNKPLPFANVFLKGRMEGSISDNQGNFSFKTKALGKATLLCSYIGYHTFEKELELKPGSTIEVKIKLKPEKTSVWFRCCNTFHGTREKEFAIAARDFFNAKVIGHTYKIHALQSSTYTLEPGEEPEWSDEEGGVISAFFAQQPY